MRKGFTAFSANKDIDLAPRAKVLAADSLMKWRRLVLFTVGDYQRRFIHFKQDEPDDTTQGH
jgi:hypothetical protein